MSNSLVFPALFESHRATALITPLRGSPVVYTGWPKPMTISFARTRRTISASASLGSEYLDRTS